MENVAINQDTISLTFNKWDLPEYEMFLKTKQLPEYDLSYDYTTDSYNITTHSRFAHILGIQGNITDHGWLPLADYLLDYQAFIVREALKAKRFAVWSYTGSGKTPMYLEFARQVLHRTDKKVLLIVPLNIMQQTIDMANTFYNNGLEIKRLDTRADLIKWCDDEKPEIGIVNPEKFIPRRGEPESISEIKNCAGVVLDESSLLKTGGGVIKWALIKSCKGVEYKLSCTATPAPNDTMEYASQGSFLEKLRNEGEILWTFFKRDKEGNWKVKKHAEDAFYRFMAGWSIYLNNPKNYGFADHLKDLPDPVIKEYELSLTPEQREYIFHSNSTGQMDMFVNYEKLPMPKRIQYSEVAKGFIYGKNGNDTKRIISNKPSFCADLIKNDVKDGLQSLCWTVFDEESAIMNEQKQLEGLTKAVLTGKTKEKVRIEIIEQYRKGNIDVLISKASLLGYGLNFQNCGSMVYSGFDDSFEMFYQSMRRAVRYGQKKAVRVHIPFVPELEGTVWRNVKSKEERFLREIAIQEQAYIQARRGILNVR